MLPRFKGKDGPRRVRQAMLEQRCVAHSTQIADELLNVHKLIGISTGDVLINQDGHDNDIYFILAGTVSIRVNGREVAVRLSGQHVGEMAMIDPSAKRSTDVVAIEDTVLAKVAEPDFSRISQQFPELWRRLAMELAHRLRERSKFHHQPNSRPVISSVQLRRGCPLRSRLAAV